VALVLYRALSAGAAAAGGGPAAVIAAAQAVLDRPVLGDTVLGDTVLDRPVLGDTVLGDTALDGAERTQPAGPWPRVDYLALVDARSYTPVRLDDLEFHGSAVLAVAARVGTTRLIDNVIVGLGTERHAADD
jgi:pantoate--beta-alanine ligase